MYCSLKIIENTLHVTRTSTNMHSALKSCSHFAKIHIASFNAYLGFLLFVDNSYVFVV